MTADSARPTLRTRLAVLYSVMLTCSSIVLLAVTDLPLLQFGNVRRATGGGVPLGPGANVRTDSNLHEVLVHSATALAVLVPASIALGWLMAERAMRPLRVITAAARTISDRNLNERLNLSESYEEFAELGATLDDLFGRLEASFDSQRRFAANASHELRTPLAAERTLIQVALADPDATAETLRATCQQLLTLGEQQERLIEALLTLASGQGGLRQHAPVDLAELTRRVVGSRGQEAAARSVRIETDLRAAVAAGDPRLAESLVANLVDNALRHNVTGGLVKIATSSAAETASLSISNTGPVIPASAVDRLFQPFQQLGGERVGHSGGYGLGLAIVAAIANAHGAKITAAARPGGGLHVTVTFGRQATLADAGLADRPEGAAGRRGQPADRR
jgi:signal transduction histidine kinase